MSQQQDRDYARQLAALASALHAERQEEPTLHAIVRQAQAVVPDAEHVSLTVRQRRGGFTTLETTSALAAEADQLQYDLNEGPCLDSAREGGWWRSGGVSQDPRWPRWGPGAGRLGVGSLLSVRLMRQHEPYGAINLYSREEQRFADADHIDRALLWATHAADALTAAQELSGLETALASRHVIGMAQGIVMHRFGLSEEQSFSLLCRLSSHRNEKLREIAHTIVRTGEIPAPPSTSELPPGS